MQAYISADVRKIKDFPKGIKKYNRRKTLNMFSFDNEFCHLKDNIKYFAEKAGKDLFSNNDDKWSYTGQCKYDNIIYSDRAFTNDITVKIRAYYFRDNNCLWKDILEICPKVYDYIPSSRTLYVTVYVSKGKLLYSNFDYYLMDRMYQSLSKQSGPDLIDVGLDYYLIKEYNEGKTLAYKPFLEEISRELYNEAIISDYPQRALSDSRALWVFYELEIIHETLLERKAQSGTENFFKKLNIDFSSFIQEISEAREMLGVMISKEIELINESESYEFAFKFREVETTFPQSINSDIFNEDYDIEI